MSTIRIFCSSYGALFHHMGDFLLRPLVEIYKFNPVPCTSTSSDKIHVIQKVMKKEHIIYEILYNIAKYLYFS